MIDQILKEYEERFPNKLAEVIDDFGSTVKNDIENFIKEKLTSFEKTTKEEFLKRILPERQEKDAVDNYHLGWNDCIDNITYHANKEGIKI